MDRLFFIDLSVSSKIHLVNDCIGIGNKVAMLVRVFIQINPGGTFWSPNVQYIEIRGWEVGTGKEVTERIIIKKTS